MPEDARLYVLGFPQSSDLASAEGLLSSHFGPGGKWQTTLPLDYGNSGGPVFDIGGRVIGVAAGGLDHARAITYVIPFNYARPLRSIVQAPGPKEIVASTRSSQNFPFSYTVDHQEKREIQQDFCLLDEKIKITSFSPVITSINGEGTKIVQAAPNPARQNCVTLSAFVAGSGVDRIGPIIVNYRGRGWLAGQLQVEGELTR